MTHGPIDAPALPVESLQLLANLRDVAPEHITLGSDDAGIALHLRRAGLANLEWFRRPGTQEHCMRVSLTEQGRVFTFRPEVRHAEAMTAARCLSLSVSCLRLVAELRDSEPTPLTLGADDVGDAKRLEKAGLATLAWFVHPRTKERCVRVRLTDAGRAASVSREVRAVEDMSVEQGVAQMLAGGRLG